MPVMEASTDRTFFTLRMILSIRAAVSGEKRAVVSISNMYGSSPFSNHSVTLPVPNTVLTMRSTAAVVPDCISLMIASFNVCLRVSSSAVSS